MALIKCPECSREISDRATACPHCGVPLASSGETDQGVLRWENCEIVFEKRQGLAGAKMRFWARAIGPEGQYAAAASPDFGPSLGQWFSGQGGLAGYHNLMPQSNHRRAVEVHDELVNQLIRDNWEHTGRGHDWFNDTFRRPVS